MKFNHIILFRFGKCLDTWVLATVSAWSQKTSNGNARMSNGNVIQVKWQKWLAIGAWSQTKPDMTQTMMARLMLPVFCRTPVGEMKMPEPMMLPTMTVTPFIRLILAWRRTAPSPLAAPSALASPSFCGTSEYSLFFASASAMAPFFFSAQSPRFKSESRAKSESLVSSFLVSFHEKQKTILRFHSRPEKVPPRGH